MPSPSVQRKNRNTVLCAALRRELVKDSDLLGTLSLAPPRVKLLMTPLSAHAVHTPRHSHFMHVYIYTRMSVFHARIPGSLHFTHAYPVSQHSAHAYPMLTSPCIAYWSYVGTLSRPYLMKKTGSGSAVYVIIILNGAIKTKHTPPPPPPTTTTTTSPSHCHPTPTPTPQNKITLRDLQM